MAEGHSDAVAHVTERCTIEGKALMLAALSYWEWTLLELFQTTTLQAYASWLPVAHAELSLPRHPSKLSQGLAR